MSTNAISLKLNDLRKVLLNLDCLHGTILRQGEDDEGIIKVTNGGLVLSDEDTTIKIQDHDYENQNYRLGFPESHRELGKLLSLVTNKDHPKQDLRRLNQEDLEEITEVFNSKKVSLSRFGFFQFLDNLINISKFNPKLKIFIKDKLIRATVENLTQEVADDIDQEEYLGPRTNRVDSKRRNIMSEDNMCTLKRIKYGINSQEANDLINRINNPETEKGLDLYKKLVEIVYNNHTQANLTSFDSKPKPFLTLLQISYELFSDKVFKERTPIHKISEAIYDARQGDYDQNLNPTQSALENSL